MNDRTIKVRGLNELQQKLDMKFLVQPEMGPAVETFSKRIQRGGKGLGAKRNPIAATLHPFGADLETPLSNPRNTGNEWTRKNRDIVYRMGPRVFGKMVKRIEERWAAENAASIGPGDYSGLDG